jgi:hypothetical protein
MTERRVRYAIQLTGPQLRVLHDVLATVTNDPDWSEYTGDKDWATLGRASDVIADAYRVACRTESTPAQNDAANTRFPECPECGARPGQAHDPTCSVREEGS